MTLVEVCADRDGCPDAEQTAEYCVTGAEGGTEGEGWDHAISIEVEVMLNSWTLRGAPGVAVAQNNYSMQLMPSQEYYYTLTYLTATTMLLLILQSGH